MSCGKYGNFANNVFSFKGFYSTDEGKNYKYANQKLKDDNFILSTGSTYKNMLNNIYDMVGNLMEYTDGYVENRGYYSVGGYYSTTMDYGIDSPRLLGVNALDKIGFRVVLYVKQ